MKADPRHICNWPMSHRDADRKNPDHRCCCTCDRDEGHAGEHMCRYERLTFEREVTV